MSDNFFDIASQACDLADEMVLSEYEQNQELFFAAQQLQQNAKIFIDQIPPTLLDKQNYITARIERLKRSLSQNNQEYNIIEAIQEVKDSILEEKEYEIYSQAKFLFQKQLNDFLGQKIITKYVYSNAKTGEVTLVDVDSTAMLQFDGTKMRYSNTKYMQKQKNKHKINRNLELRAKNLKNTYFEVLKRGRDSKRRISKYLNKKTELLIVWRTDRWHAMTVPSEGDINEAYAYFYLNKLFNYFSSNLEYNINNYMLKGVKEVDNVSGLLQGDVLANGIEYSIKSRGASAFGDLDIISVAIMIVNMHPNEITVDTLKNIKYELSQIKTTARHKLDKEISEEYQNIIYELQNKFS